MGTFNNNSATNTYKLIHKKIHKHIFTVTYICSSSTFIIHTFDTISSVEIHMGKTTKALFIWHEKYMAPFCLRTKLHTLFQIFLPYIYRLISPLMIFGLLSLLFLYLNLLMICTQPGSTQLPLQLYCQFVHILDRLNFLYLSTVNSHTAQIE